MYAPLSPWTERGRKILSSFSLPPLLFLRHNVLWTFTSHGAAVVVEYGAFNVAATDVLYRFFRSEQHHEIAPRLGRKFFHLITLFRKTCLTPPALASLLLPVCPCLSAPASLPLPLSPCLSVCFWWHTRLKGLTRIRSFRIHSGKVDVAWTKRNANKHRVCV